MVVNQRDVLLIQPPSDTYLTQHPFIVLSVREANEQENTFVAVMITSSDKTKDEFSFDLVNEMFEKSLDKQSCHVRMHLILSSSNKMILQKINTMKIAPFKRLMKDIGELVFNYDFTSF